MVVNDELKEPIRSHMDLEKGNAKFTRKATKVSKEVYFGSVCACLHVCVHVLSIF